MAKYSTPKLDTLMPCDGYVFEVDSVLAMLMHLDDSRKPRGKVYALAVVLFLMLLAKLSGADSQRGMTQWLDERKDELAALLQLPDGSRSFSGMGTQKRAMLTPCQTKRLSQRFRN